MILTESFNKADSSTLGPDQTWTEVFGDMQVVSNQAGPVTNGAARLMSARVETNLASADQAVRVTVTALDAASTDQAMGVALRYSSGAETYYSIFIARNDGGSGNTLVRIRKCVAGVETGLAVSSPITLSLPNELRGEIIGSNLVAYWANVQVASASDSAITGNLRAGMVMYRTATGTNLLDDWAAFDISTISPWTPWPNLAPQLAQ